MIWFCMSGWRSDCCAGRDMTAVSLIIGVATLTNSPREDLRVKRKTAAIMMTTNTTPTPATIYGHMSALDVEDVGVSVIADE